MQQRTRTIDLDRRAIDPDARTIKATLSTEQPVDRFGESEVLEHSTKAINFERASSGLPLLFAHDQRQPVGVAENIRLEGRELKATLRFSRSAKGDEVWRDVADGVLRHLSIGYRIDATENTPNGYRATRWTPMEASVVSVPADHNAQIGRSFTMHNDDNTETMTRSQRRAAREAEEQQQRADQRAAIIERQRITGITDAVRAAKLPDEMAEQLIEDGTPIEAARAAVLAKLGERPQPREAFHYPGNVREDDFTQRDRSSIWGSRRDEAAGSDKREAMTDGLLLRAGVKLRTPHRDANAFTGHSVAEIAAACVGERLTSTRDASRVLKRAMSASDFPYVLANVLGKSLRLGTESEAASHRRWCRVTAANDMRALKRPILGSAPDLEEIVELGEYTHGALSEEDATLTPAKFGRIVQLSWESLLADDLGAFARMAQSLGAAAMRAEADVIYDRLTTAALAGQNLADGVALFYSSRNNAVSVATGTGKPLTAAALGQARAKLRRQTAVGGGLLNLGPRTLLVPPEREHEAEVLVAASTVHTATAGAEAPGGWLTGLQVIAEPRLANTDTVYLLADSSGIDTAEVAVVDNGPTVEEERGFDVDALSWKVRHAFAAGFVDFRGIVKLTLTVS